MKKLERFVPFIIDNLTWVLLFAVFIISSIFIPRFMTERNVLNLLEHASVLGIMVVGQSLCFFSGNFDLSAESTLGLTALVGAWLITAEGAPSFGSGLEMNLALVLLIMFSIGILIGFLNGLLITRLKMNNFIVTLSGLIIYRGLTLAVNSGKTISQINPSFLVLGQTKIGPVPISIIIMVTFFLLAYLLTRHTQFGRDVYAVGGNKDAALASGINADRRIRQVYILSGIIAAFAGWMYVGRLGSATASMGQGMIFEVNAAAVIGGISLFGGRGNIIGALGGVILLSSINSSLTLLQTSPFLIDAIRGAIIIIAMVIDAQKLKFRKVDIVSAVTTQVAK